MTENSQEFQPEVQIELSPEAPPQIPSNDEPILQIILPDPLSYPENPEETNLEAIKKPDLIQGESYELPIENREIKKNENMMNEENEMELEMENLQELGRNMFTSKKKYTKQNLRTYQDLVSIIHNKSSCEWQESRYSLPMKSFTPACFWFMLCANYFPNLTNQSKEEIFRHTIAELDEREFSLISRLNKQLTKNTIKLELEDKSLFFSLTEKMSRRFDEIIQNKGVFDLTNNDDFYSNSKHFPFKATYTKEDDNFIAEMRKYGIEKFDQYFQNEENINTFTHFDKAMAFKQLPIDYMIELLNIDRVELRNTNMQKIGEIKKAFFNEDVDKLLVEREYMDPENILKDLEFLTTTETEFLNYLELKQQHNLALMNMDLYDDEKISNLTTDNLKNITNELNNSKNDQTYNLIIDELIHQKPSLKNENGDNGLKSVKTMNNEMNDINNNDDINKNNHNQSDVGENSNSSQMKNDNINNGNPTQSSKVHKIMKDDIVCQVCNDGDYSEDNMIVFCSKCNISVHQKCYELSKIPLGDWICSLCRTYGPKGKYLRCPLCTKRGGVMKSTDVDVSKMIFEHTNPNYTEFQRKCVEHFKTHLPEENFEEDFNEDHANDLKNEESYEEKLYYNFQTMKDITNDEILEEPFITKIWIHLSCGLWTPEVFLEEKKSTINIKGVENIDKKRFHLLCCICKAKKAGACIQCVKGKCQFSFHPECARRANHYMEIKEEEKLQYCIFCYKHTPLKLKRFLEMKSKKHKKEIMKFCHNLEKFHDNYHYEQKLKETNISDKKKFIQNYISRIMKENKKKDKDFISNLLAFMKRLPENLFQINLFKKGELTYTISDTRIPKKIHLKTNIPRSDEIWKHFKYKNLNPAQLYKRYRKIIVGTKIHKNINSIKKLGNLKEIADMRAIKKLMNIEKDEDFHVKERIYETRKLINKPISNSLTKMQNQQNFSKKSGYLRKELILEEVPLEPDNTLYCFCQKLYHDGDKMIACDKCNDWLHFECIGYLGEVESKFSQELKFVCPRCDEKDEENVRIERRKEYDKLFSKYYREHRENLNLIVHLEKKEENVEKMEVSEEKQIEEEEEKKEIKEENENLKEEIIFQEEIKENMLVKNEGNNLNNNEDHHKPENMLEEEKKNVATNDFLGNIETNIIVKIDSEENLDPLSFEKEENSLTENSEKRKNKKGNLIEFNCITRDNLKNEPTNNFNNQTLTKYFVPLIKMQNQQSTATILQTPLKSPSKSKKTLNKEKKKKLLLRNLKTHQAQNVQSINIVQNINIIQNTPNTTTFPNIPSIQPPKSQETTPLKTGKIRNSESITKKKGEQDGQIKLDKYLITPKKKDGKRKKLRNSDRKKRDKKTISITVPQENGKIVENCNGKMESSSKKRGRKRKEEKKELKIENNTIVEGNDLENENKENQNSEFKRETRSKKIKH